MATEDSNERVPDGFLDSPFAEELSAGDNNAINIEDEITRVEDQDDSISIGELNEEHNEARLENLRREINLLQSLVANNPNAACFAQCIESAFNLEIDFELAWNLIIKRMQYHALRGDSVITLDQNKLRMLQNDLSRIRRINSLVNLMRSLGSFSLEDKIVDALINKEFGIQDNNVTDNNKKFLSKLEKLLQEYADKLKDMKIQ